LPVAYGKNWLPIHEPTVGSGVWPLHVVSPPHCVWLAKKL
jgi:hypothetical protein